MEQPSDTLRVVLADHNHFFREGLRSMLEANDVEVVGEADDGADAIELARGLEPDVVVIDPQMPDGSGTRALQEIVQSVGNIVVLTTSAAEKDVLEALAAGAGSYIVKEPRAEMLVGGIRQAANGHAVLSIQALQALMARASTRQADPEPQPEGPALTVREREVLALIVEGADNAKIGTLLSISRHTVKRYVTNILEKLEVSTRVEAAVYAVRAGLVQAPRPDRDGSR